MTGPREDPASDAEIDRRFADLIQGYYDDLRRADPPAEPAASAEPDRIVTETPQADWITGHPLFQLAPEPDPAQTSSADTGDGFEPAPPPPLPRVSKPTLVGALMLTVAVLTGLLAVLGLPFPPWVGWLAITGFTLGMVLLLSRLPRNRDPEDGDGAVL